MTTSLLRYNLSFVLITLIAILTSNPFRYLSYPYMGTPDFDPPKVVTFNETVALYPATNAPPATTPAVDLGLSP